MGGNYIKIDRGILEWEWYKNTNTKALFLHCLLKANWKDGRFEGVEVKRGSFVTSLPNLSEETSLTVKQVRTALEHLKMTGELAVKRYPKFSLITINNYGKYQLVGSQGADDGQSKGSLTAVKGQPNGSQRATIEEYKEYKEREEKKETIINSPQQELRTRKSIPPTVDEVRAYCRERGNGIDAEHFCDFYESKNWMIGKNKMKDWQASIRTWEQKNGFKPKPSVPEPKPRPPEEDLSYNKEWWDSL